jgi:hypothetical protein
MKDMIRGEFEYQKSLQQPLASCPNLRVVVDTIAEDEVLSMIFLLATSLNSLDGLCRWGRGNPF